MSLHAALSLFVDEYAGASKAKLAKNALADFIRKEVPAAILDAIGPTERYLVEGSPGQGVWAGVPWAAVFDRLITESAQDGYYVVYLIKEDLSGIYLSLNQGITSAKAQYGASAKEALRVRASDFRARLGHATDGLVPGTLDLAVTGKSKLGTFYEQGSICSLYYPREALPLDDVLKADLHKFLDLYLLLVSTESRLFDQADAEDDEQNLGEQDLHNVRVHKRIERNKKLSARAKKVHGYVCKSCGFDFEKRYGTLGKGFIEAHHLTPLSELKGHKVLLDPLRDFTVLCSNCHRMIHRSEFVSSVEEFRAKYLVESK
jgi:5-methylcytosine-specific restriction enzyme A